MIFDRSNTFKLEGNFTAGIVEDALRIQNTLVIRWQEIQEKVCL